jgi:acyl carrier protein
MKTKLKQLIIEVLKINEENYSEDLEIGDIPEWDSANNVRIIQRLEEVFSINIDISDAIEIEGIKDILILLKKYEIREINGEF